MARASVLHCPRDGTELHEERREDAVVDRCASCRGMWVDAREILQLTRDQDLEAWASSAFAFARRSAFGCPRCAGVCVASRVGGVGLDTCTSCHGVWLDEGELEAAEREARTDRQSGRPRVALRSSEG